MSDLPPPPERHAINPTLVNWAERLTVLAVALAALNLVSTLSDIYNYAEDGFGKMGLIYLSNQLSMLLFLLSLLAAFLPDIVSGAVRPRDWRLRAVFLSAAASGLVTAAVTMVAIVLDYQQHDPVFGPFNQNPIDHLVRLAFPLLVGGLGLLGMADSRFVGGLGHFRPPPPRPDLPN
jgi:hypothetical protein